MKYLFSFLFLVLACLFSGIIYAANTFCINNQSGYRLHLCNSVSSDPKSCHTINGGSLKSYTSSSNSVNSVYLYAVSLCGVKTKYPLIYNSNLDKDIALTIKNLWSECKSPSVSSTDSATCKKAANQNGQGGQPL